MRNYRFPAVVAAFLLTAASAMAARPQIWNHSVEKDFAPGKFHNIVVDSYGQLTLGRQLTPIKLDDHADAVSAFTQSPDGAIFFTTTPQGKVFRLKDNAAESVFSAPKDSPDITAIAPDTRWNLGEKSDQDQLLVAVSGDDANLLRINPKDNSKPVTVFHDKTVSTIWAIAIGPDGSAYLGTGPHGTVYKLDASGKSSTYLETKAKNIVSLAFDKTGNLIAGTDGSGLVIRVDKTTSKPFVLLDAGKVDINAIICDDSGKLFVATARATFESIDNSPDLDDQTKPDHQGKSKPGNVDPLPVDPPDADAAPTDKKGAMITLPDPSILALDQTDSTLLKVLESLKKAHPPTKNQTKPNEPDSHNRPATNKAHKKSLRAAALHEEEEPQDTSSVYSITPDGIVTTLVSEPDANYSLLLAKDELLIGTGNEGKLLAYRFADESLTLIARLEQEQISSLFAAKDGTLFLGTGNAAAAYTLGANLAPSGTFLSPVLDADHTAHWGRAKLTATLPDGAKATLAVRSGNTRDVESNESLWSPWSPEIDSADGSAVPSPAARFLQYRLTLTGDAHSATPLVSNVHIVYQVENLPPRVKNVTIDPDVPVALDDSSDEADRSSESDDKTTLLHITWEATDPNHDSLTYRLLYRQVSPASPDAKDLWTPLAKNLKEMSYDWDTKALSDGKYQVKVIASDAPDNTPADGKSVARLSAPVTIDHTPPVIGDLKTAIDANKVTITGEAADAASAIVDVRYQVDGRGDWQPAAASDTIFDSPKEAFTAATTPLSTGGHRIAIRATDAHGNASYKSVTVTIK